MYAQCSHCKKTFEIPDGYIGQPVKCLICGQSFLASKNLTETNPQQEAIQNAQFQAQTQNHCGFNPGVAALLSFIIPGAGQLYKGQVFGGLVWFFFVAMGYMCFIIPGMILHLCCIFGAASGSAKR